MRRKKWMQLAALVAAGTMIISGCGISAGADSATTQAAAQTEQAATSETAESTDETAAADDGALVIKEQGIFSAGGTTITSNGTFDPEDQWEESGAGQTAHVDHANVLYQIPENETELPMVFLHGYGQSRMGWMTTPDGREGWSDMFLRKGHGVFLIDEPRRGEAGATSVSGDISTKTLDQRWYTQFRIGRWENGKSVANEGTQFPNDDASVARTGKDSILVTHSQGGGPGWTVAEYTDHIAAIIAIEPGGAPGADSDDFKTVLEKKIPVTMYFGDYIDNGDPAIQATGMWQAMRQACYDFEEAYNAQGGNCTVVDLPKEGITGNDHFMFQDLNNDVIADHVENWIRENVK
ncbi:alpha/beta hydrolase [Pilosibacter fragilis]|uniref:alpha/beta hydrolase n=1 Tax=Pilosibacter fragilis TaxID=3078042 RepID=UPI0032D38DC3